MHSNLTATDELKLGQVKVWGVGSLPISSVAMKTDEAETLLTYSHNPLTEVSLCVWYRQFIIIWTTKMY